MPGKASGVAEDAIGKRKGRLESQIAGAGVTLVTLRARPIDIEKVLVPILQFREITGPMSASDRIQAAGFVLLPSVEVAGRVDGLRSRRPDPKCRSAGH